MDQTTPQSSIIYHITIQLINHNIFFNSFSYSFSRSTCLYSELTTLHLIYFLSTCPNHLILVSTIFSGIGATPTLSNIVISNPIPSSLTTHPMQHHHLCYAKKTVSVLYNPTLCLIQHSWSLVSLNDHLKFKMNYKTKQYPNEIFSPVPRKPLDPSQEHRVHHR
jgi:hypothetical protein